MLNKKLKNLGNSTESFEIILNISSFEIEEIFEEGFVITTA